MQAKLAVSKEEKAKFADILKSSKGSALAKIWNNPCKFKRLVNVQDVDCFQEFNVNLAANFVFSWGSEFGSIGLAEGEFEAGAYGLTYATMVDLGEIDFSQLSKNSDAVKKLGSFPLSVDFAMNKVTPTFDNPQYEGLTIKQKFPAKLNHSYLLRSVVFGNRMIFTQNDTMKVPQMQEAFYAFQVLKINDDIITFIWKKISAQSRLLK